MDGLAGSQLRGDYEADYFIKHDYSNFDVFGTKQAFTQARIDELWRRRDMS